MSSGGHDSDGHGPQNGDDDVIELDSMDMQSVHDSDELAVGDDLLGMDEMAVLDAIDQPGDEAPQHGAPPQGAPPQGAPPQGVPQGSPPAGVPQGSPPQGAAPQGQQPGSAPQGAPPQGAPPQGAPPASPGGDDGGFMADVVGEVFEGEADGAATPADPVTPADAGPAIDEDAAIEMLDAQVQAATSEAEDQVAIDEVGIDEVGIDEVGIDEVGIDEVGIDEVGIDEVGIDEVGIDEVGIDEMPVDDVAIDEAEAADMVTSVADAAEPADYGADQDLAAAADLGDLGDAAYADDADFDDEGPATPTDPVEPVEPPPVEATEPPPVEAAPDVPPPPEDIEEPPAPADADAPLIQPPPPELEGEAYLQKHAAYRSESRKLARSRRWKGLAEITTNALKYAEWAAFPEVRSSLLVELARLHSDRLKDDEAAEATFKQLAEEDPTNREALGYLDEVYRDHGNFRALHDLYANAVERTWDPSERLELTRQAVELANEEIGDADLAIQDWENLWELGESSEEVATALTRAYRTAGHWGSLARFIANAAEDTEGTLQRVHLREVAEIHISARRAPEDAKPLIEAIRTERPLDPVALLATTRIAFQMRDFDQLAALSRIDGLREDVARDIRRVSADALWQAGERELAVDVYERLLEDDPDDRDALRAKETYFSDSGNYTALCGFLEERADRAGSEGDEAERRALLQRAAEIAEMATEDIEHAISLWQRIIDYGGGKPAAWRKLVELYEKTENMAGVATALEGLLERTAKPANRIDILARLGEIYAHHLNDDDRAEENWRALLNLRPTDVHAQAELADIYARRGDFDELDQTLRRQVASASDDDVLELVQAAARNVEEHIDDPKRAAAAWEQVLDYAPRDTDALNALAARLNQLDRQRERIAALELRVLASAPDDRVSLCLDLAQLWEAADAHTAAVATYERILRADPTQAEALSALEKLTGDADRGAMRSALELAANLEAHETRAETPTSDEPAAETPTETAEAAKPDADATEPLEAPDAETNATAAPVAAGVEPTDELDADGDTGIDHEAQIRVLQRVLDHVGADDHERRASLLRRLIALGDDASVKPLGHTTDTTGNHEDLASMLLRLASESDGDKRRADWLEELASVYEKKLESPARAWSTLASIGYDAERHDARIDELERLGRTTERWEDLLAIYDGLTTDEFDLRRRRKAHEARARILEDELGDPARAFEELRRLLMLDTSDDMTLERAEKLAEANDLQRQLAALYGELWDRASTPEGRRDVAERRHKLVSKGDTNEDVLEALLLRYRVDPSDALADDLVEAADALDAWSVVLPRIEAAERGRDVPRLDALLATAKRYEEKLDDPDRAFELVAEGLLFEPADEGAVEELERLAESIEQPGRLAQALRAAAARADKTPDALELYRRVAEIYRDVLDEPSRAIDIHRRILRLAPEETGSIDALVKWHRDRDEWSELRDRLEQRIRVAEGDEDVTPMWMEVASISRDRLDDPEGALEAYSRILADNPDHEGARKAVSDLTGDEMSTEMQARRLRLELRLAEDEARPDLLLQLAKLQDEELKQPDGAQQTLYELVEETGADGPGFEPLAELLERRESWNELIELLEQNAAAILGTPEEEDGAEVTDDDEAREAAAASLRRALSLCDEQGGSREDTERIARKLRALEPDNRDLLNRLGRAMRASGRWEELADFLDEAIATAIDEDESLTLRRELARVQDLAIEDTDRAKEVLDGILDDEPEDLGALFHLGSIARRHDDLDAYIELRERQAKQLEPKLGALVHCHLAEVYDENDMSAKVAVAYRNARGLDRDNPVAGDALRALGRRLRNWRESAALLPDDDEKTLSWPERSKRLTARASSDDDTDAAQDWLLRAIATDPDNVEAWQALAEIHSTRGDADERFEALLGAVGAFERSVAPSPDNLREHADVLHEAAEAARAIEDDYMARKLDAQAHNMAPSYAPATLAVADAREADGDIEGAFELYDTTLSQYSEHLDEDGTGHAIFRRGELAAALGNAGQAIDDLRATVRRNPLHLAALDALARLHDDQGHPALALANLQQALCVAAEREERGGIYHRLGQHWEDGLDDADEAGPYYELALEHGAGDAVLMKRALDHYRRDGRVDEALAMVDELTEQTTEPNTLATLWITRGEILEEREPDEAIEAFDMALSYEPGAGAALDGLERMLAKREEWTQLADLLEGRIDGSESKDEKADALLRLADLADEKLDDVERANNALRRMLDIRPSADAVKRLLANLGDAPAEERQALLERAIEAGENSFEHAIELANLHLSRGRAHQAWAILAPLRVVIHLDQELKDTIGELRQEYERAEPEAQLEHVHLARPELSPMRQTLIDAMARMRDVVGPTGRTNLDDVVSGAVQVSESTPNGKIFAQLRDAIGVEGAELWRATDLEEEIVIIDGDPIVVCLKTEIFQKASRGELWYWLAEGLELAAAPFRPVSARPADERPLYAPALLAALGLADAPDGAGGLVDEINDALTDELREELTAMLEFGVEEYGTDDAESFWEDTLRAAELVAAFVVFDLRSAWRALSRQNDAIPEQRSVKSLEDVNALFDDHPLMHRLLQHFVTDEFGSWLD